MTPDLVYVHGIGNKPPTSVLKARWDHALSGHSLGAASHLAYWADIRYAEPLPSDEAESEEPADSITSLPGAELEASSLMPTEAFIAATKAELGGTAETTQQLETFLVAMAYSADAAAVGSESPPTNFEVLPGPRFVRVGVFRALVRATLHDVHAYFFREGQREAIRDVLRQTLDAVDGPVVVIGHSLGSVIAYDVLHETRYAGLEVPLFVTAGSPLGISEVQDLVHRPLTVPAQVESWLNVADGADIVALDPTIRPEYEPPDLCTDALVVNTSANRHGISEYLRTQVVRNAVGSHTNLGD